MSEGLSTSNQTALVHAAVSEYNEPYDTKTQPVKAYPRFSFRLETPHPSGDNQLYEGVRYAWLCFAANCPWDGGDAAPEPPSTATLKTPFKITALRLVAKFQPIPYTGRFRSSDAGLERVWYTGAYGVRANMQGNNFGSILVDRGDRAAFQGDGHPSMAAAEAAFGGPAVYKLVKSALQITDCHNDNATHHLICR